MMITVIMFIVKQRGLQKKR